MDLANARSSMVLPVPGTSSKSTWPEHTKAFSTSSICRSLPTIARETEETTFSRYSVKRLMSKSRYRLSTGYAALKKH